MVQPKLYNDQIKLLEKINQEGEISANSLNDEEKINAETLSKFDLIKIKLSYNNQYEDVFNLEPSTYISCPKGKIYLKHLKEDKAKERKIYLWYPTIQKSIWAIIGFFSGMFFNFLLNHFHH